MDLRERWEDHEEAIRTMLDGFKRGHFFALPCLLAEDSTDGHTCKLQAAVKAQVKDPKTGEIKHVDLPLFGEVPIHFPSGGGTTHTFPNKKGEEALAIFSSRPIDSWWQSGDKQNAIDNRMVSMSDAMALVGYRSNPRKLSNVSQNSHQVRDNDRKHVVDHNPSEGVTIHSASDGGSDGWGSATTYFQSIFKAATGIVHKAVSSGVTHLMSVDHSNGPKMSANNDAHNVTVHPSSGVGIKSSAGLNIQANTAITGNASVSGILAASGFSISGGGGGGGGGGSYIGTGAGSSLTGDLSGVLPNALVVGIHHVVNAHTLPLASNDSTAAAAGVVVGGFYRDSSNFIKVRMS